jgi:hypothetical protein
MSAGDVLFAVCSLAYTEKDLGWPDFWILSVRRYSKKHNVSETDPVTEDSGF